MPVRTVCFWPGLPAAWFLGSASGLAVALVFAWLVSLLVVATFVWPDWISLGMLRLGWCLALGVWLVSAVRNVWRLPAMLQTTSSESLKAFTNAQAEYLRGNWFEAEAILLQVLHGHPRDAEAMLLLVGVLRHTQRWQPALRRIAQLELIESSAPWRYEILREKSLIQRSVAGQQEETLVANENTRQDSTESMVVQTPQSDKTLAAA